MFKNKKIIVLLISLIALLIPIFFFVEQASGDQCGLFERRASLGDIDTTKLLTSDNPVDEYLKIQTQIFTNESDTYGEWSSDFNLFASENLGAIVNLERSILPNLNMRSESRFTMFVFINYNEEKRQILIDTFIADYHNEYNLAENVHIWNVHGDPFGEFVSIIVTNIVDNDFVFSLLFFADLISGQRESKELSKIISIARLYTQLYNQGCDVPMILDRDSDDFYNFVMNK